MREEPSGARDARDPNHIWLRQSVTFSVNGQTRTLELALPLRPGATPDEVEALLDEADAGMRRLSSRLDTHLAEVTGAAPIAHVAPPAVSAPERHETPPAPRPATPTRPVVAASAPAEKPVEKPAPRPTPAAPAAASPAASGPDLTRPEFLTAAGALGLDARTVMERLNVRSLNGLNLREALDLLRRQVVRDGGVSDEPVSSASPAAPAERPAPIGAPRFDEEDDSPTFELSYPDPDDLPGDEEFEAADDFAPHEASPAAATQPVPAAAISDVPDLEELLNGGARKAAEDAIAARARDVIATMRAAHPGGQATPHQRSAYENIVIGQIGETQAAKVARAVWNLTPDRLGPEHYDAFTRWGKADEFAEEVEAALTILRAEYAAEHAAKQSGKPSAPAVKPAAAKPTEAPPTRRAAQGSAERPAPSRGRTASSRNGSQGGE